ncbi:hypothetical protein RB653_007081 [Dictyostelium firmibasis]|uniref:Uncharacterized protein n=1 Tax=Dictyostelium firmibasis TaxID=79012 RepID=A0AAN7YQX2_9MYCE
MVRVNCDYIPAWPFVYYKTKENYKEVSTILHVLWPFFVWTEKAGTKLLAFLYILFRLTYKEKDERQFIDFFWPIIHIEYNSEEFRFGIRPLFWIISGKGKFKLSIAGIINIFSKDDGEDVWFTIAPFIWYRYYCGDVFWTVFPFLWVTRKNDKWTYLLIPVGLLKYQEGKGFTLNIALIINIMSYGDDLFSFMILPFFIYHNRIGKRLRIIVALLFYFSKSSNFKRFVIFPILWSSWSSNNTTFNFIPIVLYMRRSSNVFLSICFFYYYRKISNYFKLHFIPLALFYKTSGDSKFLNIALLYTYKKTQSKWWHIVLPIFWYRMKKDSSFFVHVWPFIGYRKSWKQNGHSIYFIYPFIQFNTYNGGDWVYNHFFYRFIHYYRNKESGRLRYGFFPFFVYSDSSIYNKGHILLYMWYFKKIKASMKKIKMKEIEIASPNNNPLKNISNDTTTTPLPPPTNINLEKPSDNLDIPSINLEKSSDLMTEMKKLGGDEDVTVNLEKSSNTINLEKETDLMSTEMKTMGGEDDIVANSNNDNNNDHDFSEEEKKSTTTNEETIVQYSFIFRSLLPLAFYINRDGTNSKFFLIPLFIMKWSLVDIDSYFFSPIYYQRKLGTYIKRFIIPIFYQKHTEDKDVILSPLYYYYRNSTKSFRLIAPIFIDVHKGETHLMILVLPMYIYYRKSIFKFQTLFPFFFRTQDASKNELFTYFFPFYGKSLRGSKVNRYFFFPIFRIKLGKDESKLFSLDFLFPLFHYESNGTDNSHSIRLLPFFWKSKNDYNEMLLIMPFFWRFITDKDTRPQRNTLILPFYYFRDSAEYMFTFASPAFLPPYYIHYHREASNVENRYLFPFYSHQIKGLDHLKWFCWFLYRHTYRDFSENFTMNILLFFKHNSEKYSVTGLIPLWVYWNDKVQNSKHVRIALLLAYDKVNSKLKDLTRLSILWLVTTHLTLFCRKTVVKRSISKTQSIAESIDQMVLNESRPTDREVDVSTIQKLDIISDTKKTYLWPLFHKKSERITEYNHFALLWFFRPFISFFYKSKQSTENLWYIFMLAYYKFDTSATTCAIIWFFHPLASCFLYEVSPFSSIIRMFPVFWYRSIPDSSKPIEVENDGVTPRSRQRSSTRVTVSSMALSILYVVPNFGLFNLRRSSHKFSVYFLPLFYYFNSQLDKDGIKIFSLFWFVSPIVSLFNYNCVGKVVNHRLVPLYYRITTNDTEGKSAYRSLISFIWLAHPKFAFFRYDRNEKGKSIVSLFPIFWRKKDTSEYHLSILFIIKNFGFIDYWSKNNNFKRSYILFLYYFKREKEKKMVSIIYLFHPRAAFILSKFAPNKSKIFVFLALYFRNCIESGLILSILWIAHPKVAFISYWSKNKFSHFHIFLFLWLTKIEEFVQFGLLWIGATKKSLYHNSNVNQGLPEKEKTHHLRKPISLFLAYNDGDFSTVHLMPIFRYWVIETTGLERFWGFLGIIYFSARNSNSQFRFFYRWIRIKTGNSLFIFEFNPFFAYKKKNEDSTVLILGGMCGCYTSMCRVCCVEC